MVNPPPRKSTARDVAEFAGEGALGLVPLAGSAIAAAPVMAVSFGFNKRQQAWFDEVATAINDLQERDLLPPMAQLAEDPVFQDAVVRATRAADATHDVEKMRALRNGLLNSVGPDAPKLDEQLRFFRFVEQFSALHLRMLAFYRDPRGTLVAAGVDPPQLMAGGRASLLQLLPDFGDREVNDLLAGDLASAGLGNGNLNTTMTGEGVYTPCLTPLGQRFYDFIATER